MDSDFYLQRVGSLTRSKGRCRLCPTKRRAQGNLNTFGHRYYLKSALSEAYFSQIEFKHCWTVLHSYQTCSRLLEIAILTSHNNLFWPNIGLNLHQLSLPFLPLIILKFIFRRQFSARSISSWRRSFLQAYNLSRNEATMRLDLFDVKIPGAIKRNAIVLAHMC